MAEQIVGLPDSKALMPKFHLIVDFEATCCDDKSIRREEMEIIEIGSVMVDERAQIVDEFGRFVRPVRHAMLTPFCTELTSIRQEDVAEADTFPDAAQEWSSWLDDFDDYDFCSWGNYDYKQLARDCLYHRIVNPLEVPHRNLKEEFTEHAGTKKRYGMKGALIHAGLPLEGTHHRGIDDARNIARLLEYMLQ